MIISSRIPNINVSTRNYDKRNSRYFVENIPMRVLIMPSPDITMGSMTRCISVVEALSLGSHQVASVCTNTSRYWFEDIGVKVFPRPEPVFDAALADGIIPVRNLTDYVELVGLGNPVFVQESVNAEVEAISIFKPDIVFCDFNLTAPIATQICGLPLASTAQSPFHPKFAAPLFKSPKEPKRWIQPFNRILQSRSIKPIQALEELCFMRSEIKINTSVPELEPFLVNVPGIHFVGPLLSKSLEKQHIPEWMEKLERVWVFSHQTEAMSENDWHLFKVNTDGSGLVQLTDGPADDFDPCFLPNGRIVFVTERRGGYLRCGRHCPVYTMYSMEPDGSDIICISFHETHEWHPSVDNDGMLVYTRWDYVDRDTNIAHHIWRSFPDGRNPRSFHGNYPLRRENRPWMEMSIRAIPGSHRYVATTGSHHGNAFGSLVMIDPRIEDDRAMAQLTRLTPDTPFPEAEGKPIRNYMTYGTPWPLSEDDYLCVYDENAKNRGIYWIDRFGNRELIYRDPSISCLSPIPLRARPVPPVIPTRTVQTAKDKLKAGDRHPQETITIVNVYDSDFDWPQGSKVTAIRIIQALPKTTPPPNQPRIGVANQTNARAVLGTVPVEPDGSAYFEAPVGKAIYFQALDDRGMAIQSMRSATYVHPGEQMTCLGCHERKHRAPKQSARVPLAVQRAPSKLRGDVDGSNPFNYVRLVQPVLDRNCEDCHRKNKAVDLAGVIEGKDGWTRSYNNLAEKYGFYFHVGNGSINKGVHGGSRTIPGKFGARASGLLKYMDEKHYGVKLSKADYHRLVLWLDCNSEFYGSYENTEAQARGLIVHATLD